MTTLTETLKSNLDNPASSAVEFDLHAALDEVLGGVGLTASDSGGKITFYGKDPIVPSRLRFGTMSAVSLAAKAVGAAAIWRFRSGGEGQDIHVDVRTTAGSSDEHTYVAPDLFTADTPLGLYQGVTEQVVMSRTPGSFRTVLVPRGSSKAEWES